MLIKRNKLIERIIFFILVTGIVFLTRNAFLYWCVFFSTILVFLKKGERFLFCISFFLLMVPVYFGFLRFSMLPQVLGIIDAPIFELIKGMHPWLPRYFITSPAILIHKLGGQDINNAYIILCIIFMSGTIVLIKHILTSVKQRELILRSLLGLGIYTLISTRMNGRLIPAYFGIALIICVFSKILSKKNDTSKRVILGLKFIVSIAVGSWLTMVSSGTMMVSFALIIIMLIYITVSKTPPVYTPVAMLMLTLIGCAVVGYAVFMTNRNIVFFSDDLYGLLMHGLVRFIDLSFYIRIAVILITPVAITFVCVAVYFVCRRCLPLLPALLSVPISICCGLFGISTATMMIPALIVLFLAALPNITLNYNKEQVNTIILYDKA